MPNSKSTLKKPKSILIEPAGSQYSMQYGEQKPPELFSHIDEEDSPAGAPEVEQEVSIDLSDEDKGSYTRLPDTSADFLIEDMGLRKKKTGVEAIHDMFLGGHVPEGVKRKQTEKKDKDQKKGTLGGVRTTQKEEEEWQRKLMKLPGVIGEDNVERLKN